jgi:alpha-amylase
MTTSAVTGGGQTITHKEPRKYKMAQAIALGYTYGHPRIMSSYFFEDTEEGPPHEEDYTTKDVIINPDGSCGNGWVCEHRWAPITGMAGFAKAAKDQPYINRANNGNEIAWSRGDRAFIAITNNEGMDQTINTGLPAGTYCDVITGCGTDTGCTGKTVEVDGSGNARIVIDNSEEPMVAIHVEALSGSGQCEGTPEVTTTTSGPTTSTTRDPSGDWQRTVVYIFGETQPGEDVFFRGGINHDQRPGCSEDAETSACAIPIDHVSLGTGSHYEKYDAWRSGDDYLDWYGAEANQGSWQSQPAEGTPSAWTTNEEGNDGYQPDNQWGPHYWKAEFDMDCSAAESGWFELKAYISNGAGWEGDINQGTCMGGVGGTAPYTSDNHMGRCGHLNRFTFSENECYIESIP